MRVFRTPVYGILIAVAVAAAGLWVRSGRHFDMVSLNTGRWVIEGRSWRGRIRLVVEHPRRPVDSNVPSVRRTALATDQGDRVSTSLARLGWDRPVRDWYGAFGGVSVERVVLPRADSAWMSGDAWDGARYWVVTVPHLFAVLLVAAVPAFSWLVMVRRCQGRRRGQAGLCTRCGYDLRATPEGGGALLRRCPECGTAGPPLQSPA